MANVYLSRESIAIIEKAMTPATRDAYKNGKETQIIIERRKPLLQWGKTAILTIAKGGKIINNSLVENAWNYNKEEAAKEAANAVDFFICGGERRLNDTSNGYYLFGGDYAIIA